MRGSRPEWSDDLVTGDLEIDGQHKTLVAIAQRLHQSDAAGSSLAALASTLRALGDYAGTHFAAEEKLMAEMGFPEAAAHRAAHAEFRQQLVELEQTFGRAVDKLAVAAELAELVASWFVRHLRLMDRPFIDALRRHREALVRATDRPTS